MKPKNVIVWILVLGIVVLLTSTSVQAKELTEINATAILEKIENGENIYLKDAHITGKLNLNKIELITIPITRSEREISLYDLEEELKIVESNITIQDSVFEEDVDFSNTQFRKDIDFRRTVFLGESVFCGAYFDHVAYFSSAYFDNDATFSGTNFSRGASFFWATFSRDAVFRTATFSGGAHFLGATFSRGAYFSMATFSGDAVFNTATFSGDVNFWNADFSGDVNFWNADFSGDVVFKNADFSGDVDFKNADFSGDVVFSVADFSGDVDFSGADFSGDVDFSGADFSGDVDFSGADFNDDVDFSGADFSGDVDFSGADFNDDVDFSGADFSDVAIFSDVDFNRMKVEWNSLKDALVFNGPIYIKLIKDFREMEQFEDADAAYYQYRRLSQANKEWSYSKLMDVVAGASCGYGVKPERPLIWAFGLIMVFTLVYWLGKGIKRLKENDGDKNRVSRWAAFYNAFYFSVVTFTTVGYGDWYPEDRYRIVVMIEGVLGWLLLALFIVTLANVMIRP